ncbi:MFS transporter [Cellulomonas bogoriensis 69B4 = DSM 16987]|uniref:MFS transporter n=1 Tax=Cellulomonas bogoriensis 69B4 = DSM 16987 TaxID=1386082 RepID=A0A0A0BLA0_9CELL|nr:MFS transporter [Cellulomonas bogoriensis 69B4 = DSM 16987]
MPWLVVWGIVLAGLSLRGPMVAPAPVIGRISEDVGLTAGVAGLVTSLPVLCFALTTPLAPRVIRRVGAEGAVVLCLLGVLAGTLLRSAGPAWVLLAGTVVIGVSITIGNVVTPVIIRREVPASRVGAVTGAYSSALNVGSMITSLGTAPLAGLVGWRWALVTWGTIAAAGAVFWWLMRRRALARPNTLTTLPPAPTPSPVVVRVGWLLTVTFAAQSFAYMSVTAWLPSLLADEQGLSLAAAGATASFFQVSAVVGALGVPALTARSPAWVPMLVVGALWCALPVGLLVAPGAFSLWAIVGGVAQGAGFTAIFSIVVRIARSDREATYTSAKVQTGGYYAAATGPVLVGHLYATSGGWDLPLLVVLGATCTFVVFGVLAALSARRPA